MSQIDPHAARPGAVQKTRAFIRQHRLLSAGVVLAPVIVVVFLARGNDVPKADTRRASASTQAAGDTTVTLDTAALRLAGIETRLVTQAGAGELLANGIITFDANRVSVIASRSEGRIVAVRADLGQAVNQGTVLAVVESPEVGGLRSDLERARANVEVARKNYERERRLFDQQISPQKELLDAENTLRNVEADYTSALSRLGALGAGSGKGARFGLVSPVSGTVVERNASPGQTVGSSNNLFTVADLRHVWITVDVYEGDVSRVRQGAAAAVVPTAFPTQSFPGRVTFAGGIVDPASRTFKVRVEVENSSGRLRPGMFAQVRMQALPPAATNGTPAVSIPEIAVQDLSGKPVVFVASATPGRFLVRPVTLGARSGDGMVQVLGGVLVGESIAVNGAFRLKAELEKASLGEPE